MCQYIIDSTTPPCARILFHNLLIKKSQIYQELILGRNMSVPLDVLCPAGRWRLKYLNRPQIENCILFTIGSQYIIRDQFIYRWIMTWEIFIVNPHFMSIGDPDKRNKTWIRRINLRDSAQYILLKSWVALSSQCCSFVRYRCHPTF